MLSGVLMLHHSMSSLYTVSAVCYVPAVGVGGRRELKPSQVRQAGVDQLCDTATSRGLTPKGGVTSSTPCLLVAQKPWPLLCVCVFLYVCI